ncbi:MAG: HDOD domain-containing protein [Candidatus Zixiibacteriota bacterium]
MKKISIIDQIRRDTDLLSLPQVLSEVLGEVGKEDFSANKLADIILKDPSLTSRVLRMSNSSFYQRFAEIKTVHQAISVLGATTVKCLALSTSVFHPEKIARESGVDAAEYFMYVLSVAAGCQKIARAVSYPSTEEAFIAGLLHDIGVMFFLHKYPREYKQIIAHESHVDSLAEAEKNIFGTDHTEVGLHMAEVWRIPREIVEAIGNHHSSPVKGEGGSLSNIVRLAVLMSRDRWSGYEVGLEDRLNEINAAAGTLSLSKDQIDSISSSLLIDTLEIAEYLGLDIGNVEAMLTQANQEIWKTYLIVENLFKERQELSQSLLREERAKGAVESKNIAMATLSHYLNNAVMAIYGRSQILRLMLQKGQTERILEQLEDNLQRIDQSVKRIVAVLEEMKQVSPIDQKKFDSMSKAMNIDDRIAKRLAKLNETAKWDEVIAPPAK